jgi:hypothetical protein
VSQEVEADKTSIYEQCISSYKLKYAHMGQRDFEIIPLWFGARGSIPPHVVDFFSRFQLDLQALPRIAEEVLVDTVKMVHHFIYA